MLESNDHRRIARRLDLLHMQPDAPGMVFWHPRGLSMLRALENLIRREMRRQGFAEVRSPQLLRQALWESSGHWAHFRDAMFVVDEDRTAALKPVSCPAHLQIAKASRLSYRELPLRLGEIGVVHRNESSGNLHGLFRLRQFAQDDGHILCTEAQVAGEVTSFLGRLRAFYAAFDLVGLRFAFSSRPSDSLGSDDAWRRAEALLRAAAEHAGIDLVEQPGEGAFYGPKIEVTLHDRRGRAWQCGTIQIDLVMPERFDVRYVDADDRPQRPVLIHRALLGSLERFLGVVLENWEGALPAWLAPEQVLLVPVREEQQGLCHALAADLANVGVRTRVDTRAEGVGRRVDAARELAIPIVAVIGPREASSRTIPLRQDEGLSSVPIDDVVTELSRRCRAPL